MTRSLALLAALVFSASVAPSAQETIRFNDQNLWLSGGNVAWVNFSRDIGPGATNLARFEEAFSDLHASGGNSMRLWLHTTGDATPAYSTTEVGVITGPGEGTIADLEAILDLAWENEVGLVLCLWSFDMLQSGRSATKLAQNQALLQSAELTQTYIDNALTPMVEALADHPAVVAWEIFNEPEGMSGQFGWTPTRVNMTDIQRFVNQTAGAIHRAAPDALVTNGSWSFRASSDVVPGANNKNYYSDAELIAAGGDADGTLDFYSVHYYEWGGTTLSPFHHDADHWGLDKPIVMAEFFLGGGHSGSGDGDDDAIFGVPYEDAYTTLYDRGYAGAMGWQWYNFPNGAEGVVNWPRILENAATMFALHPADVDIDPGFQLTSFTASPQGIEAGQESVLSWSASHATVTLDGTPVDPVGTMTVAPTETTTYTLVATNTDDATDTLTEAVTVTVLDPDQVNRARGSVATASTYETCCGTGRGPEAAVDGDPATRWSSAWNDGSGGGTPDDQLDDDPDDEWLAVDLGGAFDVARVVLDWEAAYATQYAIETSYDGVLWTPVFAEAAGDGGTDEILFDTPVSARYVRMHGIERVTIGGTQYGYSLFELEVYGLESSVQPPTVEITAPGLMAVVAPGASVAVAAAATDADGTVASVVFYLDGTELATDDAAPFTATWPDAAEGAHVLTAVATDDTGIAVSTAAYPVTVAPADAFRRFEAEAATRTGDVVVGTGGGASGGAYASLNGENGGTLAWDVEIGRAGTYLLSVGYRLPFDEKTQYVGVNGDSTTVRFTGAANTWLQRSVEVNLAAGTNEIRLERFWGYMDIDYLGVEEAAFLGVATEAGADAALRLLPAVPNPVSATTVIPFETAASGSVRLDVFDVTGRRIATLADGPRAAGRHEVRFDTSGLSSGIYLVRLQSGGESVVRQIAVAR
ncbi:MAG: hypothetical protein CMM85_01400 [Rhodothermaceae bacterium]|nr:hypothetical protein [Rhodothermaceae bacterium]